MFCKHKYYYQYEFKSIESMMKYIYMNQVMKWLVNFYSFNAINLLGIPKTLLFH